jgi:hypothetical protein
MTGQEMALPPAQFARKGMNEDVSIKIQHANPSLSKEYYL